MKNTQFKAFLKTILSIKDAKMLGMSDDQVNTMVDNVLSFANKNKTNVADLLGTMLKETEDLVLDRYNSRLINKEDMIKQMTELGSLRKL